MFVLLIFVVLFFLGGGYNIYTGSFYDALCDVGIALFLLCIYAYFSREDKKNKIFIQWIMQNQRQISGSGLEYENKHIVDSSTELSQYFACISFVVFTIKLTSRYFIKGTVSSGVALVIYTLTTFLLGWWAFPKGPISTVQCLFKNLTGRSVIEVRKLFAQEELEKWG